MTSAIFQELLGYKGNGQAAELILEGNYDNPVLDEYTLDMIRNLQRKTAGQIPMSEVAKNSFLKKIKPWPEKTSTSPSGIHLGHYKCLCTDPHIPQKATRRWQWFETNCKLLIEAHLDIINYAIRFGYTFEWWQTVKNMMVPKEEKNRKIHQLRVIHLYEANYNLLLGIKWREALHHSEDKHLLNDSMYGSRPGRSTHEPILLEVLQQRSTGSAASMEYIKTMTPHLATIGSLHWWHLSPGKNMEPRLTSLWLTQLHSKTQNSNWKHH